MITTRRESNLEENSFRTSTSSNVGLLEREVPSEFEEKVSPKSVNEDSLADARAKMKANLDMLLNYDRHSEVFNSTTVMDKPVSVQKEAEKPIIQAKNDEDIRPTSTTMQFGDSIDSYNSVANVKKESDTGYKLNGKGKLVVVLYALAVAVIMALIIINTGVLGTLRQDNFAKKAELNAVIQETNALYSQIEEISSDEYISSIVENELGMSK